MTWPPWEAGFVACAGLLAASIALGRTAPQRRWAKTVALEAALLLGLYGLWRLAQVLHVSSIDAALDRGRAIYRFEKAIGLPDERWLSGLVAERPLLARLVNAYYGGLHVPATAVAVGWIAWRRRQHLAAMRTMLVGGTALALVVHLIAVAPPRLLPDLGFVDVGARFDQSVYGPVGTGLSDQFGAMPSVHVLWACVAAWATWRHAPGWWRWTGPTHLTLTWIVIMATANHWWLDGVAAHIIIAAILWLRTSVARRTAHHSNASSLTADAEVSRL